MLEEKNILITGVTGNLGSQLLKLILDTTRERKLSLLVRAENEVHARKRIDNLLKWLQTVQSNKFLDKRIRIFVGDVSKKRFGLKDNEYDFIKDNTEIIYHVAALTRFHDPISKLRQANVVGTQRILDLICKNRNPIEFNYISTAFVAGNFNGIFRECDFDVRQKFNNPYEQSKFEAEREVRKFCENKNNVRIFRPSIIVGEYQSGAIAEFQMFYKPLYLFSQEVFEEVPFNHSTLLNLIPVDIAAKMIFILASNRESGNHTYHIVSPTAFSTSRLMDIAAQYFRFKRPKLLRSLKFKESKIARLYENPIQPFFKYFTFKTRFECKETLHKLKMQNFFLPEIDEKFLIRIFDYAVKRKYIKVNQ